MSTFRTDFEAEAMAELLGEFGELVTYKGRGAPREITAIVIREPLAGMEVGDGVAPLAVLRCSPDPDFEDYGGIDPEELHIGGHDADKIWYAVDIDGEESWRTITKRFPNEGGFVMFEVR